MPGLTISVVSDVRKAVDGLKTVETKIGGLSNVAKGIGGALGTALGFGTAQKWASEWTGAARDANKAMRSLDVVFGESKQVIVDFAKTSANALGLSQVEAQRYAITLGNQLKGYGLGQREAAEASEVLIKRASDMAYVLGTDVGQVLDALGSALRGRTAGLKALGVNLDSAEVKARLAAKGLGELEGEEASAAQATEILAMVMEKTGDMAGVFSDRTGNAAKTLPALGAAIDDVKVEMGQALLPVMNLILPVLNDFAQWAKAHPGLMQAVAVAIIGLSIAVGTFSLAMLALSIASAPVWGIVLGIGLALAALIAVVILVVRHWDTLTGAFRAAIGWLSELDWKLQVVIAILGGPLAGAALLVANFGTVWGAVKAAVDAVASAIERVIGIAQKAADTVAKIKNAVGGVIGAINPFALAGAPGGAFYGAGGPAAFSDPGGGLGAGLSGGGVIVEVHVEGDVADPVILGRRIVNALEAWTQANGRRRLAGIVGATDVHG